MTPKTDNYIVPQSKLFAVPLPLETRTYKPVSHKELSDVTLEAIHAAGFSLGKQTLSGAREGQVANGRYTITSMADSEMQLEIGWQNSYNKSLSLKFAIGTRIMICDNGCVSGDLGSFKKKHMGGIMDYAPLQISEEIKKAGETFRLIQDQRDSMKNIEVDSKIIAQLVGRMFIEDDLINSHQLGILKKELVNPTFDYGADSSLWTLYQHTTFAMKETHPLLYMDSHMKIHNFFMKSGLEAGAETILLKEAFVRSAGELFFPTSVDSRFVHDPCQIDLEDAIIEFEKNN